MGKQQHDGDDQVDPAGAPLFALWDPLLLRALQRTLLEGKFANDPEDLLVSGSPQVAEVCRRVEAARSAYEQQRCQGLTGARRVVAERVLARYDKTRALSDHPHAEAVVKKRIAATEAWAGMSESDRAAFVRALAAPFEVDAAALRALLHGPLE